MRWRGVMRAVATCWLVGCGFDATGSGDGTDSGSSGAESSSSSVGGASSEGTNTSTTSASSSSSSSSTSDGQSSGGVSSTGATDGGADSLLGDDALLVRYYLDEVAPGSAEGQTALDAGGDPTLDLPLFYDAGSMNPAYVEDDGQRGLSWSEHGQGGRAEAPVAESKLMGLNDSTEATIEVVVDLQSAFESSQPWARILLWQPDIVPFNVQMGLLGYRDEDAFMLDIRSAWQVDNDPPTGRWSLASSPGRIVVHAVFDTTLGESERVRLFIDGELAEPVLVTPPAQDETLFVSMDAFLLLGNRPNNDTSFGGTLYYAAIYDRALSSTEVGNNAGVLLADDDRP